MIVSLLIVVFVLSFVLTFVVKKYAKRMSIIDIPNDRSSHTVPTPRGGGLAIVIAWFAGIFFLFFVDLIETDLFYALLGAVPLMVVGIIDDSVDVKPIIRILIQSFSTIWALWFLGGLPEIDFGFYSFSNIYINNILIFFVILWFINLFNFIDGIDGYLASGVLLFSIALFVITNNIIPLISAATVAGFLIWNWHPAKIFMGDVGSTVLGYNFIVLAVYFQNSENISFVIPIILSSVFWFDATFTLFRRFLNKEKLNRPHKKHAYQRLTQAGFSHQKVVILFIFVNVIIIGIAYFSYLHSKYILVSFFSVIFLLFIITKLIDRKKPFKSE
ncbi:MAG: glycosyl transferase [Bacteroidetes bacterium]|nr:MAG: glycosyl transferase [Bacteroidota bacterium]